MTGNTTGSQVVDTGPLDWRIGIVDKAGRPTSEFQRRWQLQRGNNALIGSVTFGMGAPTGTPADGAEYVDTTKEPFVLYIGDNGMWNIVGVQDFIDLKDVPGNYTSSSHDLLRVNGNATGIEFVTVSTGLDNIGNTTGDILIRGNSTWGVLAPGNSTTVLTSNGSGATPTWQAASGGGGGGGGTPPTIRGSGIQNANASSYTVTWPTGTVAGDLALIFAGHGFNVNNPSGWTIIDNRSGSNANGAIFGKVLTSGDISTGSVAITAGSGFFGIVAIVTFVGKTSAVIGFNGLQSSSAGTTTNINMLSYITGVLGLYWGYSRGTGLGTFAQGTLLHSATTSDGVASLYTGTPTAPFVEAATYTSSSASSGIYMGAGLVSGP